MAEPGETVFEGGGEMAALMKTIDWASTPIGPVASWSVSLRTMIGVLLRNRFPMSLLWGPRFVQLYNDAYLPVAGDKHPRALGQAASECWPEIWHIIGPMVQAPFLGDRATSNDGLLRFVQRKGFAQETHFNVAYSPVPDESAPSGIGGVLATVMETTEHVQAERQLGTLRELGGRAADAKSSDDACASIALTFRRNERDLPFAVFYLIDDGSRVARLSASVGFGDSELGLGIAGGAAEIALDGDSPRDWPIGRVVAGGRPIVLDDLTGRCPEPRRGHGFSAPTAAIALPLTSPETARAHGVLICGVSPHRVLDAGYRGFFELVAAHVATALRNASAHEEARKRSETLTEAARRQNHFLAVLSHELRNPLTPMRASLSILDRAPPSGEQALRARDVLERQMGLLTRLIDDLLDITRISRNKVQLKRTRFELRELVQKTVDDYRLFFVERQVVLELTPTSRSVVVSGDWSRFAQIVGNLLQNAAKFTQPGGAARVSVFADEESAEAVVRVADTGIGMTAETLAQLFEPFMQVEQTLERSRGGLGLGLALVRGLLELHGGTVTASSGGSGRGSEFTIRVPLDPGDVTQPDPPAKTAPPGRRVLIIEDNVDAANSIGELLELGEHEVAITFNGVDGLEKAREYRPDVVLCDIGLPGLDGYEVARRLRRDPAFKDVILVALTGYALPEDVQRAVDAGFDVHMPKPADLEALERVLGARPGR